MSNQSTTRPPHAIVPPAGAIASFAGLPLTRPLPECPHLQIDAMHTLVAAVHTKVHGALAAERVAALDPAVAARIAQGGANLAHLLADPLALLQQSAASMLAATSAHLFLALIALLLTGWRGAPVHTLFSHS